ncbi:MAG: hypothetical protein Q4B67_07990 [Eubacteriales bacterium]|nr:hypothetical protein [Eubacteriales bacterium]
MAPVLSIICTVCFSVVIILSFLLVFGLPLGEFTMGGQHKVFPKNLRIVVLSQLILQLFFVVIFLQLGGHIPMWFSYKTTRIIGIVMAVYLTLNTVMNAISKSKKERYVMTPLSAITAVCLWLMI